uniref:Dorsal n=1 Tax=Paracyclopina nana TaxID=565004 RepID=A0A0S0FBL4_PARNA|nr:dorsal [Paracyclopina nana]
MRGLTSVPQPFTPTDINLNDVIDAIRQTDPATFQSFQANGNAEATGLMSASFPPAAPVNGAKVANMDTLRAKKQAYVKITEQPASKGLRFRYECEGRSAGSIPGISSTADVKTFPSIQVVGYKGRAVVVVSTVTIDSPYRPHPHNLVGKEGCSKGVCTIEMDSETMTCSFPSLGIQCVKKKEIEESLKLRQQIRVDPFQTGFQHKDAHQSIDLNSLRLCFQVFLEGAERGAFTFALKPVVSDPIYDKKARSDLTICRMTECTASVAGGKEILLFTEKVTKDDIEVRFYQEINGKVVWEGLGEFQPSDVHKQYGICLRTPRYHDLEVEENIHVKIHLRRPSDGAISDPRPFELTPIDGGRGFWAAKRLKTNYAVFNNILSADQMAKSAGSFSMVSSSGFSPLTTEDPRRKIATSSGLMSPDSTNNSVSQVITQPIQLVHASVYPPPPLSPTNGAGAVSCSTPDLPPPPTPLIPQEPDLSVPPKAATMNLRPLSSNMSVGSPEAEQATSTQDVAAELNGNNELYDDVDTKYDGVDFFTDPPQPPIRKRPTPLTVSTVPPTPIEEPVNRPLPETPAKKSSLISKFKSDKKEKLANKGKKAKQEMTTLGEKDEAPGEQGNKPASLFQRLFSRSKSVDQPKSPVESLSPEIPAHRDTNGNDDSNLEEMKELQDFIDAGNLEQLDNMVTEFAKEYMNDPTMEHDAEGNNNGNEPAKVDK